MRHKKIENKLILFLENSLSESERNIIDSHLKDCPECSAKLNILKNLWETKFDRPKAPDDLWLGIENTISPKYSFKPKKRILIFKPVFQPILYLALIISAIFLGTRLGNTNGNSGNNNQFTSTAKEFFSDGTEPSPELLNKLLLFAVNEDEAKK